MFSVAALLLPSWPPKSASATANAAGAEGERRGMMSPIYRIVAEASRHGETVVRSRPPNVQFIATAGKGRGAGQHARRLRGHEVLAVTDREDRWPECLSWRVARRGFRDR